MITVYHGSTIEINSGLILLLKAGQEECPGKITTS